MRTALPASVHDSGVIAVLRAADASHYLPVCEALVAGGITALELTLTTPGTIEHLDGLVNALPGASIGVGTVTAAAEARAAIDAGASFLVSPLTDERIADAAVAASVPLAMGALSPTEVARAWKAGASAVKIFPASTVGADYLRQLRGPFPDLVAIPSGGVGVDDIAPWLGAGAAAVSVGGPLLRDAFAGGDLGALTERAALTVATARALLAA